MSNIHTHTDTHTRTRTKTCDYVAFLSTYALAVAMERIPKLNMIYSAVMAFSPPHVLRQVDREMHLLDVIYPVVESGFPSGTANICNVTGQELNQSLV